MLTIIAVAWTTISTASFLLLWFSRKWWRQEAEEAWEMYSEVLNEALQAQEAKGKAESDLNYLKVSLHQMAQRPVMAMLTEEQIHQMTNAISSLLLSAQTPPDKMN